MVDCLKSLNCLRSLEDILTRLATFLFFELMTEPPQGDSTPTICDGNDDYFYAYGSDYFYAAHSIMLHKTYLGGKVQDALAAINLLKTNGTKEINLVGRGLGAIVAAFAATLSEKVNTVTLINAPVSYQQMIEDVMTYWPLSHMPQGILKVCDLPDIYQALEAKSLKIIDQWDSMFRIVKSKQ